MDRREFIKILSATAGSAFFAYPGLVHPQNSNNELMRMNRFATFAVLDDVVKIAVRNQLLPFQLLSSVYADFNVITPGNFSRVGWMTESDENSVAKILVREKERSNYLANTMNKAERDNPDSEPMVQKVAADNKAALMLGWFMADGIRTHFAPSWQEAVSYEELSIYQDMFLLKKIAGLEKAYFQTDLESLFCEMIPRMITRTHTLTPDYDDGFDWTVRITDWHKELNDRMKTYAQAFANPDAEKLDKYVHTINLYNEHDPIIEAARSGSKIDLDSMSGPESLYGKALYQGVQGLVRGCTYVYPDNRVLTEKSNSTTLTLHGNYPNPFNPTTTIRFDLDKNANVKLEIVNIKGQTVFVSENYFQSGNNHEILIDGLEWASGSYFYTLTSTGFDSKKYATSQMVLIK